MEREREGPAPPDESLNAPAYARRALLRRHRSILRLFSFGDLPGWWTARRRRSADSDVKDGNGPGDPDFN